MYENLEIFRMSGAMAAHAGRRQALSAQNMANLDTPGFHAQRLPSFADLTEAPDDRAVLRATRGKHLYGARADVAQARIEQERGEPSPNGNTVSLEREMLASVEAKREHDRALAIYKSALTILRTAVSR